ncbi:MAG: hypothetical protein ACT4NY_33075 [Pseudonocardiales bacterium]
MLETQVAGRSGGSAEVEPSMASTWTTRRCSRRTASTKPARRPRPRLCSTRRSWPVDRASFAASNSRLGVTFDAILTAESVGSYKPSPRNFAALVQRVAALGIGSGRLLHVAQSLFHDHVPAKRAGLRTVWINRRHDHPGWGATPDPRSHVIPDWEFPTMAAFAAACAHDKPDTS